MNYIELINNFWRLNKEHSFTSNETQVYFKLLDTCNSLGWKNPFNQSNLFICAECGMSEPTLIRVRNSLKQLGLIDFTSGKVKRQYTSYAIIGLNNFSLSSTQSVYLSDTLSSTQSDEKSLDNIKQDKLNKKEKKKEKPGNPVFDEFIKKYKLSLDECKQEFMSDELHIHRLLKNFNLDKADLLSWVDAYFIQQENEGVTEKTIMEAKSHFGRWLPLKIQNGKDRKISESESITTTIQSNIERLIAEDRTRTN